jgi:hypothetical protein
VEGDGRFGDGLFIGVELSAAVNLETLRGKCPVNVNDPKCSLRESDGRIGGDIFMWR